MSVEDIQTYIWLTILLFIDCSKMVRKGINTTTHTKDNCLQSWCQKSQYGEQNMCMYVSEIYAEGIFVFFFPRWLKNVKSRSKITFFFSNERHFEIWFPKKKQKQLNFSEENDLNYTKETNFAYVWHLHFPWNKGKQEQTLDPFGCKYWHRLCAPLKHQRLKLIRSRWGLY